MALVASLLASVPATALAATYYVDNGSASCSNSGPGTQAIPYCSITAALTAHSGPGTTILVKPGIYRETVTVPSSGSPSSPFVIQATSPGAIVDGADSFENAAQWTQVPGTDVWLAASVTWQPVQVFGDELRLVASTASPSLLPARTFRYEPGVGLYVNAGGGNPALHGTLVGHRTNGIRLSGRSNVVISGFTVTRAEDKGIYLSSSSNNCTISGNTTTWNGHYGIQANACNGVRIAGNISTDNSDHGIGLTAGSSGCTVEDNESARNAHLTVRQANGLYMYGAPGNLIQRNRFHDNQDTGMHIQSGSNNNVCLMNVSWNNGDHGYDHLIATGNSHVGDVAYGNYKDGFSIEGSSSGTSLSNCIAVNNGLNTNEYDLWIDAASDTGFVSDYNIFWNSSSQPPIKWKNTSGIFSTVAAFSAASGRDPHSIQANPMFVAPATGDFRTQAGSPAIDSGNSGVANWPSVDALGNPRVDDPLVANTGVGPILYGDRGAVERQAPPDGVPVVVAPATVSGSETSLVTVNVTASDPDGQAITSLTADLSALPAGHGATFTPGPGNTSGVLSWTPTFAMSGNYNITFTAANTSSGQAVTTLQIANLDRAPILTAPATANGEEGAPIVIAVQVSDPDSESIGTLTADLSGLPAESGATFTTDAGHRNGTLSWTPGFTASGSWPVTFHAGNALAAGAATTTIQVTNVDRAPVIVVPATITVSEGQPLHVVVTASDPDGDELSSFSVDLSALPAAVFSPAASPSNGGGTIDWTPSFTDSGLYTVGFAAANALPAAAQMQVHVVNVDRAPVLSVEPLFTVIEGQTVVVPVTVADPDGDAVAALVLDLSRLPGTPSFTPEPDHLSGTLEWTPPLGSTRTLPYRATFTASNATAGAAVAEIRVLPLVNLPPVVTAPALVEGDEGTLLTVHVTAADPEGNPIQSLTADLGGLPPGHDAVFTVNATHTDGTLTWTPTYADSGLHRVRFTATNARGSSASVIARPAPSSTTASPGEKSRLQAPPTYRTPADDPGAELPSTTVETDLHIRNVDRGPTVAAPAEVSGAEGSPISFGVLASDPDGEPVTLTTDLSGMPGATFTIDNGDTTGTFQWTPGFADSGTYAVVFSAANLGQASDTTVITVLPVDRSPVVDSPAEVSGTEGAEVSFTVSAADPDGNPIESLTAGLAALPPGAAFVPDPGNGTATFRWTPGATEAGVYTISFVASNALSGRDSTILTIFASDQPPALAAPAAVEGEEGSPITFTVHAADADGAPIDSLYATIAGQDTLPAGATFTVDPGDTTGTFAWTPGPGQAGVYLVVFGASNALAALDSTLITVTAPGSASAAARVVQTAGATQADGANHPIVFAAAIHPNPMRGQAHLTLSLPQSGRVRVDLFDVTGRHVRTLLDRDDARAGFQDIPFEVENGSGVPLRSGLYLYRVSSPQGVRSGSVVVMK